MMQQDYWNWFAMPTDAKAGLGVVVVERLSPKGVAVDVDVISNPMPMEQAEGEAINLNRVAIVGGTHISDSPAISFGSELEQAA